MRFYTSAVQWGNSILVRGYENNIPFQYKDKFSPTMYVSTQKETKYKLLDGTCVDEIKPGNIKETKSFIEDYREVEGFPIYGQTNFVDQYLSENYPGNIVFDSTLIRVHFLDIESETELGFPSLANVEEKINAITVIDSIEKKPITFGWGDYTPEEGQIYCKADNEEKMLHAYINWHCCNYPDVMSGWFSNGFDIPYLSRRIDKILGTHSLNKLSPWSVVTNSEKKYNDEMEYKTQILGIALIDYLDLYKKFILEPRENYRLDTIAEIELGKKKLDYSEFDSFKEFYTKAFQKFISYNIIDTELVYEIEKKRKLIETLFTVAYIAKINYEDVFSPVKTWDTIIYNYLRERNIVIPEQTFSAREEYPGGFVKEPVKGMYNWVASFDLQSSYPHQIMQYALSPENFVGERIDVALEDLVNKKVDLSMLEERNLTMAANGWLYKKESAMFPDLVRSMYNLRASAKKEMKQLESELVTDKDNKNLKNQIASLDVMQKALKILLNSLYGALGSPYFRYFDKRIAEGITLSGQLAVMWMMRKFNEYFNKVFKTQGVDYCIYSDTDSLYLNLEPLIKTTKREERSVVENINFMDKFCKEVLTPYIEKSFQEMADYMNAYEQKMVMGRDTLSSKGIFCSKKKYVLNEYDSEGVRYAEPKMKVVGLQMIQSSTPKIIKEKLKETLNLIINSSEEELQGYVLKLESDFLNYSAAEIAKPTGVDGLGKYSHPQTIYIEGVPYHVRGSLLYNHLVKELKLSNRYELIKDHDKIKVLYLKLPNTLKEDLISFPQDLPKEFGLHKYVDYQTQFQKVYISPLTKILDVIGWSCYKSNSMADLFG